MSGLSNATTQKTPGLQRDYCNVLSLSNVMHVNSCICLEQTDIENCFVGEITRSDSLANKLNKPICDFVEYLLNFYILEEMDIDLYTPGI